MQIRDRIAEIPGAVDAHLQQVPYTPELQVNADRTLLSQLGLSQQDVANDLLVSLSCNGQTAPNFWLDPKNGVQYPLVVQTPQSKIDSLEHSHRDARLNPLQPRPAASGELGRRSLSPGSDQRDAL